MRLPVHTVITVAEIKRLIANGHLVIAYPQKGIVRVDGKKNYFAGDLAIAAARRLKNNQPGYFPNPKQTAFRAHVIELLAIYHRSGKLAAINRYQDIVHAEKLKVWEARALADSFQHALNLTGKHKKNPVPPSKRVQIRNASKLYSDFTGHEASEYETLDKPILPDVMLKVGEIDFVGYTTVRDGKTEKYIHKFKKQCRPLFTVSHDGKQLFMLGGSYDFTERGIVDKT